MNTPPMAGATRVRAATLADAAALAPLSGQLGYPATPEETAQRLRRILDDAQHAVFVAEAAGRVAGWVHVFVYRTMESDARAEIGGLVVDEAARSRGIGRALMAGAEAWAREKGCQAVGLRSNVIREKAHAFYEALGYRLIKTQKCFRKTL
ncbi:MAG TPA: GNAT family N-acetyltransferase [Candidatus Acidoferrales bacterium]|nr:GNAT family N-acetyltransferase [Candidatus Acidoferrales bacterium]